MSETKALELLRALCGALTSGGIEVIADDQRTAFTPATKTLMVARRFLAAETPVAIGALCHEVGHVLVTRYNLFTLPGDAPPSLWWQALNAVEETRVHCFLRRRLPGTRSYLDALFGMDDPPDAEDVESEAVALLGAAATWDRHPSLPFLAGFPAAADAFYCTRLARERYARTLPPRDLEPLANLGQRYAKLVAPALAAEASDAFAEVEAEVRCSAALALTLFRTEIWPVITGLAERDKARIAWSLREHPDLLAGAERAIERDEARPGCDLARRALRGWIRSHGMGTAPGPPADPYLGKLAEELFRRYLEGLPPAEAAGFSARSRVQGRLDAAATQTDRDQDVRCMRTALVDVLRRATPRQPIRWMAGYSSGAAVDLDRVMRMAATGRYTDRIWLRRTADLPRLAALLLVDLSGSMAGPKVQAAVAATRALSAALSEVRGIS